MKGRIAVIAGAVGLIFLSCSLSAAADIKVGYLDFRRVQAESKAGKAASETMNKLVTEKQALFNQKQGEVEKLMQEVEKQSAILSPEVKKQKEDRIQKELKELQRFKSDTEEEINKKKDEVLKQIFEDLAGIINKFGKDEGYTLILDRSQLVYAPDSLDMTDRVIKAYDESKK